MNGLAILSLLMDSKEQISGCSLILVMVRCDKTILGKCGGHFSPGVAMLNTAQSKQTFAILTMCFRTWRTLSAARLL